MMKFSWFKKKEVAPEVVQEEVAVPAPVPAPVEKPKHLPMVSDYPSSEYTAYWETIVKGNKGELRFYPYKGTGLLDHSSFEGASEQEVVEKMHRAIRNKMDKYRKV